MVYPDFTYCLQTRRPCVEHLLTSQHVLPGQKDELAAAREAALAARAAQTPSQTASAGPSASVQTKDATAGLKSAEQSGAAPSQNGGLAEALERAQQLAGEKVRERLRAEQEEERGNSSRAPPAGTSIDTDKAPGASLTLSM